MSQKVAKKIRQEMKAATPDMLVMFHTYFVRPRPRWMPKWVFNWMKNIVVYQPK